MALTQLQITQAKPKAKLHKLGDGNGLRLWVFPDGAKRWRLAYRFKGKQKELAIGVYPEVGLKDAREAREAARKLLAAGIHDQWRAEALGVHKGPNDGPRIPKLCGHHSQRVWPMEPGRR
jgi:hypothetical protein